MYLLRTHQLASNVGLSASSAIGVSCGKMAKLLRPKSVVVEYYPHAKRILPEDNTVTAAPVGDLGGNYQSLETTLEFDRDVLNE